MQSNVIKIRICKVNFRHTYYKTKLSSTQNHIKFTHSLESSGSGPTHHSWVLSRPPKVSFATTNFLFGSAEINRMNRMSRSLRSPPPVCILKQSAEFQISAKHTQKADSHKYLNYTQLNYMCAPCFKTKLSINNHFLFLIHMTGSKSNNSN